MVKKDKCYSFMKENVNKLDLFIFNKRSFSIKYFVDSKTSEVGSFLKSEKGLNFLYLPTFDITNMTHSKCFFVCLFLL